jgi:hypothetical protein
MNLPGKHTGEFRGVLQYGGFPVGNERTEQDLFEFYYCYIRITLINYLRSSVGLDEQKE